MAGPAAVAGALLQKRREGSDLLRDAVLQYFEVGGSQVADRLPLAIAHDDVDQDCADALDYRTGAWRRLLLMR